MLLKICSYETNAFSFKLLNNENRVLLNRIPIPKIPFHFIYNQNPTNHMSFTHPNPKIQTQIVSFFYFSHKSKKKKKNIER